MCMSLSGRAARRQFHNTPQLSLLHTLGLVAGHSSVRLALAQACLFLGLLQKAVHDMPSGPSSTFFARKDQLFAFARGQKQEGSIV